MEEVSFKRTEGGWIFKLGNPFVIGPSSYFLVNGAQKAAIVERLRANRFMRTALFIPFFLLAVLVGANLPLPKISPWIGALAAGVSVYVFSGLVGLLERHKLAPLLDGLPRTDERITLADEFMSSAAHMSFSSLILLFGAFAANLALAALLVEHRSFAYLFGMFLLGVGAVYWGAILIVKLKPRCLDIKGTPPARKCPPRLPPL